MLSAVVISQAPAKAAPAQATGPGIWVAGSGNESVTQAILDQSAQDAAYRDQAILFLQNAVNTPGAGSPSTPPSGGSGLTPLPSVPELQATLDVLQTQSAMATTAAAARQSAQGNVTAAALDLADPNTYEVRGARSDSSGLNWSMQLILWDEYCTSRGWAKCGTRSHPTSASTPD
jgi:hypothetical protein